MADNNRVEWKKDIGRGKAYIKVGDYVVIAKNLKRMIVPAVTESGAKATVTVWEPTGELYISFDAERTFSDGTTCLDESAPVDGGFGAAEADQISCELRMAINILKSLKE